MLAFLFALTLSPIVRFLQKRGIEPVVSAIVLVILMVAAFSAAAFLLSGPVSNWIDSAPEISRKIQQKLSAFRTPVEAVVEASEQVETITEGASSVTHLEYAWESPDYARFIRRLANFSRLIRFDRRGMGLSDRDVGPSTLEERVDDIRAVMDAAGSRRAALLGVSEGGFMSVLFAATYPERTVALSLFGCFARQKWAPDYPWGKTEENQQAGLASMEENWGEPFDLEGGAPSVAKDEAARSWFGAYLRYSASPGAARANSELNFQVDVRDILPVIRVPTLVLHRSGDRWYFVAEAQYLADHIPESRLIVLPGDNHIPWWGDQERLVGEIQEFLTGTRHSPPTERVLLTISSQNHMRLLPEMRSAHGMLPEN